MLFQNKYMYFDTVLIACLWKITWKDCELGFFLFVHGLLLGFFTFCDFWIEFDGGVWKFQSMFLKFGDIEKRGF